MRRFISGERPSPPSAISGGEEEHGTGSTDGRSTGTAGRARQTLMTSRHSLRTLRGRHSTTEPIRVGHRIQGTSVPGLAAKDCIDVQIRVRSIDEARHNALLSTIGFRCRPDPWNRTEVSGGIPCRKLVFAPPVAPGPATSISRRAEAPPRYALLFRDYLRADEPARRAWGAFKRRLAASMSNLFDYGQIKAPATEILTAAAERWAAQTAWTVTPRTPPAST
ncbi:GrpB family protein [Streptomyces sp. NPDC056982]|uniref:GrpB family protein n=1 Tax=Streptomyces sp. NPDC056982 TaxID=3345986 RepID=UPI0036407FDF